MSVNDSFYKLLTRLYPHSFRKQYQEQMLLNFHDLYADYRAENKSNFSFWIYILRDTFHSLSLVWLSSCSAGMFRLLINSWFVGIVVFFTSYVIAVSAKTLFNNYRYGSLHIASSLETFVNKYQIDIEKEIFYKLYDESRNCQNKQDPKSCFFEVKTSLAGVLKEEELASSNYFDWPNDLFFVKQEDSKYLKMGWDGKVVDITSSINQDYLLEGQKPLNMFLHRHCHFFGIDPSNSYSCQVYQAIPLKQGDTGYVVRIAGADEEQDITFGLVFTPLEVLALLFYPSAILATGFDEYVLSIIITAVTPIFFTLLAIYAVKKYRKKLID